MTGLEQGHVLVVDDDEGIREMLDSSLSFAGFQVTTAADAQAALAALADEQLDVVVLDVMMPRIDGFDLLQLLRHRGNDLPVLFLTARDTVEDRVRGLRLGADDYISKPFSVVEVTARLESLLRRVRRSDDTSDSRSSSAVLRCGDLVVDEARHLTRRGDREIDLSPTEFRLLTFLVLHQGRVLSKAQILEQVWQYDFQGDGNVVERFVSNLRRKVDASPPWLIHTVRGFGYTIRDGGHTMSDGGRRSTARRLIMTLTAAVAVVLLVTSGVSILVIRGFIQDRTNAQLVDASNRIRASLVGLPDLTMDIQTVDSMAKSDSAMVTLVENGRPVMWINGDQETAELSVSSTRDDGQPHPVADRADLKAIWLDTATTGLRISTGTRTVSPSALVVATSTARETSAMRTITGVMVAGMLVALAALVLLTALIVGRGLRPLRVMSERAQTYADGDRSVRLPEGGTDPDLARLSATLNQALDAQQEAESRLRSFVADASHELRTPLTIASGWIELDLQGGLAEPTRRAHAMQRVQAQMSRMRLLVDELSLLARLDRTRPLHLEQVDLAALTAEVVDDARLMHPERTIVLHTSGSAALLADGPRLQQVVANLVGNAVQHTPASSSVDVTVTKAPTPSADGGAVHTLMVTDHGPGIPTADQAHVFERFWRGDNSRHRQTGGSGLGLAIVSSIVTAHGGSARVISEPGRGTTIQVQLPATADAQGPPSGGALVG